MAELESDYRSASLGERDLAMLAYVDKLTRAPTAITADDVETLRVAGFTDAAVLDICQVAAYYAFVNRIANGLGVEIESSPSSATSRNGERNR